MFGQEAQYPGYNSCLQVWPTEGGESILFIEWIYFHPLTEGGL